MSRKRVDNEELAEVVRAWVQAHAPGHVATWVKVQLDNDPKLWISLPVVPSPPAPQEEAPAGEVEEAGETSRCAFDILTTLEEMGHRLTTTRLEGEMARKGREWSTRTIQIWLKRMVEDGTLNNEKRAKPPGYGLPEWDAPA